MSVLNPVKALRGLRLSPNILHAVLTPVSQERALQATDGPDGWSILFIMCHLRDYEDIFGERIFLLLDQDEPAITLPLNNDELIRQNSYAGQQLDRTLAVYVEKRRQLVARLTSLSPAQWERRGLHPTEGPVTVTELAINVILHDHNHIDQMVRALGLADRLL
jgi:hypothetical protein